MTEAVRRVFAPGRVNLIGEHTDYTGGVVLPMALDLGVTLTGRPLPGVLEIESEGHAPLSLREPFPSLDEIEPSWGRFVVAAIRRLGSFPGFEGTMSSNLPIGGTGLSSSTAVTCAALMMFSAGDDSLGPGGDPDDARRLEMARTARAAEIDATGVNIGLMDQAACMVGRAGHALRFDCETLATTQVPMPESMDVLVVHSGQSRELADSAYNDRRQACAAIENLIGPLRRATLADLDRLDDDRLRRRARHVITENGRVEAMIEAFRSDDTAAAGEILRAGHASLADDYEVSTPIVDAMVQKLNDTEGIHGARMTGGGFGGSIVALCEPGVEPPVDTWWTRARPSDGAHMID